MNGIWTLLDIAGTVALLLWGVHMVQTGIQRAFGPELRRRLGADLRLRLPAFASGLAVTAILQSSTATGLMVAGFAASGLVELVPALSAMLGANVGTTLIVQVLSFNVAGVAPTLVLIGVVVFRRAQASRKRDLGRVAIGLGLTLMSLHTMVDLITPYGTTPGLRLLLGQITAEPGLYLLVAAALTWAAHSSVAVVLVIMSLAAQGVVAPEAAFAMVLGANLGSTLNPLFEGSQADAPASRRVPLGNVAIRATGCVVALATLGWVGPALIDLQPDAARAVALYHTGFNLALAMVFLPLLDPCAGLLRRLLPDRAQADPAHPLHLAPGAQDTPLIALAASAREALRMADVLEAMLSSAADALATGNRTSLAETRRQENVLDGLNRAIKAYLGGLDPEALSERDRQRLVDLITFVTNIEHAGDVIDHNLMGHAQRRLKRGQVFDRDQGLEIRRLIARLSATLRAAVAVFMTKDAGAARDLAAEKEVFRDLESTAITWRFAPPRGDAEEGALNLDLLRDLKRVNGHLVAAAAYKVLENQGDLLPSRLR